MSKNRVKLTICGTECVVASDDDESYIRSIGTEIEKAIKTITQKNERVSLSMAALITALRYCDECHKANSGADNLRSQIKDYLEDSSRSRMEADEARREIERMKQEIQTLRSRLSNKEIINHEENSEKQDNSVNPPVQKLESPANVHTGSFTRPTTEQSLPDADEFIGFFEKNEND